MTTGGTSRGPWRVNPRIFHYYMCSHAAVTTLAKTSTSTRFAPALNSALEAALAVAPEVKTSSTSTTLRFRTAALSAVRNAPWTFSALCVRLKPTWLRVALTRLSVAGLHGLPVWRETSVANAAAWLNWRRHSRRACSGTGARRSASARRSAPARAIQLAIGRASSARSEYLSRCTSVRAGPSSNLATARARLNAGGSAIACGEGGAWAKIRSNGVPRRSQNGRSMKRIVLQQRGHSAPCLSVAARQARHVGG